MTLDEVSALLGVTATELRDWQRLGLIGQGDELGSEDVERARLIVFADRRGVPPADLARISGDQGDLLGPFVRWALRPGREVTVTPDEAAERAGIDGELLDRLWTAAGLRDHAAPDLAHPDTVAGVRNLTLAFDWPTVQVRAVAFLLFEAGALTADEAAWLSGFVASDAPMVAAPPI